MNNENFIPSVNIPETPQKQEKERFLKIIIGIIILVILGTGISLATRVWDPSWNPFRPKPEKVLARMANQMKELKTYHNKITFVAEIKNETEFELKGNFLGDYDKTDPENLKSAVIFDYGFAMEGMQFSLAGETREIGEDSYLKITTIPAILETFFALMGIDLREFKNQWVKIDEEGIIEAFSPGIAKELEGEIEERKRQEKEMKEKIEKLIANKNLYFLKTELADKKIGEVKTYHYVVALNKEELKKITPELSDIIFKQEKMLIVPGMKEELQEEVNEFFDKVGEITAEVWIGKKDFYLYKLSLEKEFDLSVYETEKGTALIRIAAQFDKFNQPIEITVPEKFKTLKEILASEKKLFGPLEEARAKARDARRQSDMRQIALSMEMFYDEKGMVYLQAENMAAVTEKGIGRYLPIVPEDPQAPIRNYVWIDNTGFANRQKYCVYAHLESGEYVVTSPMGVYELSFPPQTLEECKRETLSPILKLPSSIIEKLTASLQAALSGVFSF